jgi:predicted metal-binding membrane protein
VGIMNGWWMAALAALAVTEQVAPHGHRLRVPLGVALMIAAIWRFAAAA